MLVNAGKMLLPTHLWLLDLVGGEAVFLVKPEAAFAERCKLWVRMEHVWCEGVVPSLLLHAWPFLKDLSPGLQNILEEAVCSLHPLLIKLVWNKLLATNNWRATSAPAFLLRRHTEQQFPSLHKGNGSYQYSASSCACASNKKLL